MTKTLSIVLDLWIIKKKKSISTQLHILELCITRNKYIHYKNVHSFKILLLCQAKYHITL